ncbi:DNA-binding Lrp family transcriptional regulator [Neorhizobium galegae]|uniref:winged helix-turn-helix domain-containing protein n=1 Tax=Neorhizobium galegae TaxID=399 RepID=UPI0027888EB7|nr:winged helix-turn-helix domain-containing protein [Neorhizobium galegae]MDQ0132618.1 DNA-binding Lrp family transcriptional regulator [Neorhizobium galegae]
MSKKDCLMLTDAEIAERVGLSTDEFRDAVSTLEKAGFPLRDPLFRNRRYWPACQAFMDKRYGLASSFTRRNPAPEKKGVEVW